jgi:predicted lysophospholipase L1 biosynthesis ABC-type transport system permease subunit
VPLGPARATAYSVEPRKGALPWTLLEGRLPHGGDELAVGPRLASELGLLVGDRVPVGADGQLATVVGVVQAPALSSERLGTGVVLSQELLSRSAESQPLVSALVRATRDPDAVYARYAAELELMPSAAPPEVSNLVDLGRLPGALQAFLVLVGAVALGHALVLTTRRRARDVGVLRALGFTPRQVGGTVFTMAGTTVVVGLLVGVPLGLGLGRVAWQQTAAAIGLAGDVRVPTTLLLGLVPAAFAGALAVAALPARRAARLSPAAALRAE